jgi:hypothetical protein
VSRRRAADQSVVIKVEAGAKPAYEADLVSLYHFEVVW